MDRVDRGATLGIVIMSILESGLRTTAVVSEDGVLVGVISEGDILRAVGRGGGPGLKAEDVMTHSPGFLVEPVEDAELVRQFVTLGRLAVPIVDTSGRFIRLEGTAAAVGRQVSLP
jgi:CBS domain-containing protein